MTEEKLLKEIIEISNRIRPIKQTIRNWDLACVKADLVDYKQKSEAILSYCKQNIDSHWAAYIAGILLDCNYIEAKERIKELET